MNYLEYDYFKLLSTVQTEVNPVMFSNEINNVGFYICRLQGYDSAVEMTIDEAKDFVAEMQSVIKKKEAQQ